MRSSLFKKALKIFQEGRISLAFETDKATSFKITPSGKAGIDLLPEEYYDVLFQYEDFSFKHTCTCKLMSQRDPTFICSHKLACFYYLIWRESDKLQGKQQAKD
jgi:hypothetical protein